MIEKIYIYTDGSSLGNPGPGGYGVIIKNEKNEIELSGGEKETTNNRMEMKGVIEALKWIKKNKKENSEIFVYSDSSLVINSINENWKKKKNLDLWQELLKLKEGLKIKFIWIKGHNDHKENERCDVLARKYASKFPRINRKKEKDQMELF